MQIEIVLPELGAEPVILSCWFADRGETVFAGDRLVELLIDGASFDVCSPASGRLLETRALPRDQVEAGQVLGIVEAEAGSN
jgi:pyruvate/2-oxoglutarate dehydrogenase complex dihydrolipoamide acyltransferase (E2) component